MSTRCKRVPSPFLGYPGRPTSVSGCIFLFRTTGPHSRYLRGFPRPTFVVLIKVIVMEQPLSRTYFMYAFLLYENFLNLRYLSQHFFSKPESWVCTETENLKDRCILQIITRAASLRAAHASNAPIDPGPDSRTSNCHPTTR